MRTWTRLALSGLILGMSTVAGLAALPDDKTIDAAAARLPGAAAAVRRMATSYPDVLAPLAAGKWDAARTAIVSHMPLTNNPLWRGERPKPAGGVGWTGDLIAMSLDFIRVCPEVEPRDRLAHWVFAVPWRETEPVAIFQADPRLAADYLTLMWTIPVFQTKGLVATQALNREDGTRALFSQGIGGAVGPVLARRIAAASAALKGRTLWEKPETVIGAVTVAETERIMPTLRAYQDLLFDIEAAGALPEDGDKTLLLAVLAEIARDDRMIGPMSLLQAGPPPPGQPRGANARVFPSRMSDPALYALAHLANWQWSQDLGGATVTSHSVWQLSVASFGFESDEVRRKYRAAFEAWYARQPKPASTRPDATAR